MPRQPQVHFRLKIAGKPDKETLYPIYLQFIYNGNRLYYAFGQMIRIKDWNESKQRIKKKDATTADGKFSLNDLLDSLEDLCIKTYNESLPGGIPAPGVIKKALEAFVNQNHNDVGKPAFFLLADRFINGEIKNKGKEKSIRTRLNYQTVTDHLKTFEIKKKYPITFDSITLDFFYSYTSFLKNITGLATNSIAKDISIIKVFMGEAVDLGFTTNMQFKHSKFSYTEEETDQVYLTEKELHTLYKLKIENSKLEQVRDLFIFGSWVGLRFSDFSNIKPENIVEIDGDRFIKIITKKTKELVIIPCNPVIMEIFKKYSHNVNQLPKTISIQKFNTYIKEVCKMAELSETGRLSTKPDLRLHEAISSHTARRSMSTNYYLQGFPTIDLMKITGHKTEKAFLKYIRVSKLDTAKRLSQHIKKNWKEKMMKVA